MSQDGEVTNGLICSLTNDRRMSGSVVRSCSDCRRPVWLSPDGLRYEQQHADLTLMCTECGDRLRRQDPDAYELGDPVPGSTATIAAMYGLPEESVRLFLEHLIAVQNAQARRRT